MKPNILFLAPYPNENNIKDGMISRVNAIDSFFKDDPRTYLHVSLSQYKKKRYKIENNLEVYELNILRHFVTIYKILISSKVIYSHSIYMSLFVWPFIIFFKGLFVLDAHGAVPEEEYYYGNRKKSYYYSFVEKIIVSRSDFIICVTNSMKSHFINKYKKNGDSFIIYGIIPHNIRVSSLEESLTGSVLTNKVNILYSGGISAWQNIDLMLKAIENNQSPNLKYTILTGDKEFMEKKISLYNIASTNIEIKSVPPSELVKYYKEADYAFILRDENIINNVANPTKLIEYMFYGIVPIVLSPKIGDYISLGYEYLSVEKFNTSIKKLSNKSLKNIDIAKNLVALNDKVNIRNLILPIESFS